MTPIILAAPEKRIKNDQNIIVISDMYQKEFNDNKLFVPSRYIDEAVAFKNAKVYLELEALPFFQHFKNNIQQLETIKGIFRYKRTSGQDVNLSLLAEDLFVISSLFGKPSSIFVKHSDKEIIPYHVILTVNFGNGILAHIEYTRADREEILMEWGGVGQMINFSSTEMNAFVSVEEPSSTLTLNPALIIENAHVINASFIEKLTGYQNVVKEAL